MSIINAGPSLVRLLATICCLGISFGSGLGYGFKEARDSMSSECNRTVTQAKSPNFGLAEYYRLQPGMPLAQVESILNRGVEVERSETTSTYIWRNANGSSITVVFKNGKLFNKTQVNREQCDFVG